MKLTVVGCGDAFGSGGRLQTCYCVEEAGNRFLIDCGATTIMGFNRLGLDPDSVGTILISHLHGDHFSGLVWWLLHAQYVSRRTAPLTVVGPRGIEARFAAAAEALFPGSTKTARRYDLTFAELGTGTRHAYGPVTVVTYEVSHPSGAPSYALRISAGAKTIGFSGDTEWVDNLVACADSADLFICECFGYDKPIPYHLNWRLIEANLPQLRAKRILLTHMNSEMLANLAAVRSSGVLVAEDGLVLQV